MADDKISEALEAAAKLIQGSVHHERYREWTFWPGNRAQDSDIVSFADDAAKAIRTLIGPDGGKVRTLLSLGWKQEFWLRDMSEFSMVDPQGRKMLLREAVIPESREPR